jgi:hypothetical protein
MFRALLLHLQDSLHKRNLVYCVCIISVGCDTIAEKPNAIYAASPEDEQVMLETCRGP